MIYIKCDEHVSSALNLWIRETHGFDGQVAGQIVRQKGRGWEARQDWLAAFVTTAEYRAVHAMRQAGDPHVQAVRTGLTRLGWPQQFKLWELGAVSAVGRRLHKVLAGLGYESDRNPADKQGRWFVNGVRTRGYRKTAA